MVDTESLTSLIVESVKKAQNQSINFEEIYNNPTEKLAKMNFYFLLSLKYWLSQIKFSSVKF
jgi:hypothetical protein